MPGWVSLEETEKEKTETHREAQGGLEAGSWNCATKTRGTPGAPRAGNGTGRGQGVGGGGSGAFGRGTASAAPRLQILASRTWEDTFLLLEATKSVVICSSSPRIHMLSDTKYQTSSVKGQTINTSGFTIYTSVCGKYMTTWVWLHLN